MNNRFLFKKFIRACKKRNFEAIKFYHGKGINVNKRDKMGYTGLDYLLIPFYYNSYIYKEFFFFFVQNGINVNHRYCGDNYLIRLATYYNDIELVQLLINKGAKIDQGDILLITPLMIACDNDNFEIVKLLVEAGADVNRIDEEYNSVLDHCYNQPEIIEYLKAHGAKSNRKQA